MTTTDDNGYKPELEVLVKMKCMFIFNLGKIGVYRGKLIFFRVALQKLLHLLRVFFRSIAHVHMRYTSVPEPFRD